MLSKVSLAVAEKFVVAALKANVVPYVAGPPGCGKSKMVEAIAKLFKLKMIDIRLAQEDPTTINGFPSIDNGRSSYLPPSIFPLSTDPIPKGYNGWLLFFDELPSAPRSVQAAAYKIILDKMIGPHKLHPKCAIVAAGNMMTDGAIVNEMGTALRSRMSHIHVKSIPETAIQMMASLQFDSRIVAYLNYQNSKVNTFEKFQDNSSDETFACERTWEFVSNILKANCPDQSKPVSDEWSILLQGTVGSTALEFVQFTRAFDQLPTFAEIISDPANATLPNKPAIQWLLTSLISNNTELDTIDAVMDYTARLPVEFQFATAKMLWQKDDRLLDNPKLEAVFNKIGDMLIG